MKIKTVRIDADNPVAFDERVNAALAEGWTLVKREHLTAVNLGAQFMRPMLYAELVQPDPALQEADLMGAMRALHEHCTHTPHCADCELNDVCNNNAPYRWNLPEEAAP